MAFLCTESRIAEASLEDISSAGLLSLKKIGEMKIHIIFIISTHYKCEICDEKRKTYGAAGEIWGRQNQVLYQKLRLQMLVVEI